MPYMERGVRRRLPLASRNGDVSGLRYGLFFVRLSMTHSREAERAMVHWMAPPVGWPALFRLRPQLRQLSVNSFGWSTNPCSPKSCHRVLVPAWPRFVLTMMTPFAAAVPYKAAADG